MGGLWTLAGCSLDEEPLEDRRCERDSDCVAQDSAYRCVLGYCQEAAADTCVSNAQCDDRLFCNGIEQCSPDAENADAQGCVSGEAPALDDGVACTTDVCDEEADAVRHDRTELCECASNADCVEMCRVGSCNDAFQCEFEVAPPGSPCNGDDGVSCTSSPSCDENGACVESPDDSLCDDGAFCNGAEVCDPGSLAADPETGCLSGDAPDLDDDVACTADLCNEESDEVVNDRAACECQVIGEPCPGQTGQCVVEICNDNLECEPVFREEGSACDDGVACTTDVCSADGVCVGTPVNAFCDDGAFCNGAETCSPGNFGADVATGCMVGPSPLVPDGIECTEDICDEETDSIRYEPGPGCTCQTDAECVPDNPNPCLEYACQDRTCIARFLPEGTACDDGFACTEGGTCNDQGACRATSNDALCNDSLFCNGVELCNPTHEAANGDGCIPGVAPSVDDGIACTEDRCQECDENDPSCSPGLQGEVVHQPGPSCECRENADCDTVCEIGVCDLDSFACNNVAAPTGTACEDGDACTSGETCNAAGACAGGALACECRENADCAAPGLCQDSVSCQNGSCIYDPSEVGASCDDGDPCTQNTTCNANQECGGGNFEGCECRTAADCAAPNACQTTVACENNACVYGSQPAGTSCGTEAACDTSECDGSGQCTVSLEHALCAGECRSNPQCDPASPSADADGCTYGVDLACLSPDSVTISAPPTASAGLGQAGASLNVTVRAGDVVIPDQAANLYCVGRELYFEEEFNSATTIADNANVHVAMGDTAGGVAPGQNVTSGVAFNGDNDTRGLQVCNGYGVRLGQFVPPVPVTGADRPAYIVSVTMANLANNGLGEGEHLVLSYNTKQTRQTKYVPLVAIGDEVASIAGDQELRTYEFMLYNSPGYDYFNFRLDVMSASGTFSGTSCGFVDSVRIYKSVISAPNDAPSRRHYPTWNNGTENAVSQERFHALEDIEGFFAQSRRSPGAHTLVKSREGGFGVNNFGGVWTYDGAEDFAYINLPEIVSVDPAMERSNPLIFEFAGAIADGSFAQGDTLHLTMGESNGFANTRKIASVLPSDGTRPSFLVSIYDDDFGNTHTYNRYFSILPEEAKPLLGRNLAFAHKPYSNAIARSLFDEINLYSFNRPALVDVNTSVANSANSEHTATVRSASARSVRVQCYWQKPNDPSTSTLSSNPVVIEFE